MPSHEVLTPNPTLVAIEELQLQLLQNAEAALPPMKSINPEKRLDPIVARPPPSRGKEMRAPIASRIW